MRIRHLISICAFLLLNATISAQELMPIWNFSPKDYNADTQNWDINESSDGYIYVANNKGLLEFNGARWKLYFSPNNTILRCVKVIGSRVYTGCFMEFGYWEHDEFNNLKYKSLSQKIHSKLLDDEHFWKIIDYHHWILFQSLHRIYIYDTQKGDFQIINSETNLPKIFKVKDQIYFQKMGEGLFQLESGKPIEVSQSAILKDNIIINIFPYQDKLLIATQNDGFYILDKGNINRWNTSSESIIDRLSIYDCIQLRDGSFVLGTVGEGVYLLSQDGGLKLHIEKRNGLLNNTVLNAFEDSRNNVWLALDNGISLIDYTSPVRVFHDLIGNIGTVYASICYDGKLYVGSNQGLFYKNIHSQDSFQQVEGTKGQVWALKVIDGTLFCCHNSGTFQIVNNHAKLICNVLGAWDIKPIDGRNDLLMQGNYEGLCILEKKGGTWQFRNKIEGFNISSRYFEPHTSNTIFVNHEYKGLFVLNVSDDYRKVVRVTINSSAPKGFKSGMAKVNNKIVYFSSGGFYEYNDHEGKFIKNEDLTKTLLGNDSYLSGKLIPDVNQSFWAFTENNVTSIVPGRVENKSQALQVPLSLRMRDNVTGYENIQHMDGNSYLLGTADGYIVFDLDKITEKDFKVHISSVQMSKTNAEKTYISLSSENYKLSSSENNVYFSFNVPVYGEFFQTKYRYKLEGYDDKWSEWSNSPEAIFKNLPSGKYTFTVQAKVGNKISSNTVSYTFTIARPWYFSGWMILIYIILLGWGFYALNDLYRKRYNKKAERLNKEKQLIELEKEKAIIKLTNDKLNVEMDAKNRELAATTMAIVKKNELLKTIKDEINQGKTVVAEKIIDANLENNNDWEAFKEAFNNTDRDFLKKVKELHPTLTPNDLKLCVYLRLNMSSKQIAPLLNISPQSVEIKRFRLRKKIGIAHNENLTDYFLKI